MLSEETNMRLDYNANMEPTPRGLLRCVCGFRTESFFLEGKLLINNLFRYLGNIWCFSLKEQGGWCPEF